MEKEREKTLPPLREAVVFAEERVKQARNELDEAQRQLSAAESRWRDEDRKIEKEIFQLKKLLKAGAPEDVSLLQKEFQELRTNVRKELKVERIYNPIIGGTIIKSNQRHIIAADEKIKLAIEELEELKCEVIEGTELADRLSEIRKKLEAAIKKTLSHPLEYEK